MRTPERIQKDLEFIRTECKQGRMDWNEWFKHTNQLEYEWRASVEFHRKTPTQQLCAVAQLISETPDD